MIAPVISKNNKKEPFLDFYCFVFILFWIFQIRCSPRSTSVSISVSISDWQATATRSSRSEVFCKKAILKRFTKFTGKHLYYSGFFNKFADLKIFCEFWEIFEKMLIFIEHLWKLLLYCYESLQCLWLYQQQVHICHAILLSLSSPQAVKKSDLDFWFLNAFFFISPQFTANINFHLQHIYQSLL